MTTPSNWQKDFAQHSTRPIPKSEHRCAMKRIKNPIIFCCLALLVLSGVLFGAYKSRLESLAGPSGSASGAQLLKPVGSIDLPGPKGKRFDYLTIDPSRSLLFSTHLGAGLLYVID